MTVIGRVSASCSHFQNPPLPTSLELQIPWNVLKCDKLYLEVYPPPEKEDMCCNICNASNSNQAQLAKLLGVGDREFRLGNI